MDFDYLQSILVIANVFISLFVLVFAYVFLKNTEPERDRKPWIFLLIAIAVFFLFELVSMLDVLSAQPLFEIKDFFKTVFIAIILYVFVFQYSLIKGSNKILIRRKKKE